MNKLCILTIIFFLLRFCETNAQITFQQTFGGVNSDVGMSVKQTSDSGYIITGLTGSFGAGLNDVYLIKTDVNGNPLWTKTYGGPADDQGFSVEQTTDGGYIIAGRTYSFGAGSYDIFLIKTNSTGDSIWIKTFGGTGRDEAHSVHQTTDGGYIITGFTKSFGAGGKDIYLIKTDTDGNLIWSKIYGTSDDDEAYSVVQTSDGGYIIVGSDSSYFNALGDLYLIKTDSNGDSLWTRAYGGLGSDDGRSVEQTVDGGYIIGGWSGSFSGGNPNVYLVKTNSSGDTLWTKTVGGAFSVIGSSIKQTADGGYILVGYSDFYLAKFDTVGNLLWSETYSGQGISIDNTYDGGFIITGFTGFGSYDVYLIKTDANGNSLCNQVNLPSISNPTSTQISTPPINISSGGIESSPSPLMSNGATFTTLCTSLEINEISDDDFHLSISPNPNNSNFKIIYLLPQNQNGKLEIFDVTGKKVYSQTLPQWSTLQQINLPQLSNGIYAVRMVSGNFSTTSKIILQK